MTLKQTVPLSTYTRSLMSAADEPNKIPSIKATIARYQYDETLTTLETNVVSVEKFSKSSEDDRAAFKQVDNPYDDLYIVVTAETVFYAQGGGQPNDVGHMTAANTVFEVTVVRNGPDGRILHLGKFKDPSSIFEVSTLVQQAIDAPRRETNSKVHTAGHLVGLSVRHLASQIPGVTELKAQHFPDSAFVEFVGIIDGKHKDAIQVQVDKFVEQALPVKVYWWAEPELREKCAVVPENVIIPSSGLIRAVDIVGAGAYPCGGTHVKDSSLVGKVTVKKISRQKGISKVSYTIS